MSRFEIVTTRDGHRAVRDATNDELMHPLGPRVESQALYVGPARIAERGDVVVFDVGLGAGTNAAAALAAGATVVSFDQTLDALALAVDEPEAFGFDPETVAAARAILDGREPSLPWRAIVGDLPATLAEAETKADVVFWDPYGPAANPDLWTVAAFSALHEVCNAGATVHTYGAATATRAAMLLAGFAVGRGPAIGKKQETTIAAMDRSALEHPLDQRWLDRFERSSNPLPADASDEAMALIRAKLSD